MVLIPNLAASQQLGAYPQTPSITSNFYLGLMCMDGRWPALLTAIYCIVKRTWRYPNIASP